MNTANTTQTSWTGWHRPDQRSPWRAIVTGATEIEAFNKLLDLVRGGDKCVLRAGQDPNETPSGAPTRRHF